MKNKSQRDMNYNNKNNSFIFNSEEHSNNEEVDYVKLDNRDDFNEEIISVENKDKKNIKSKYKLLKKFGWSCIIAFIMMIIFIPKSSVNTSDSAKKALKEKVSTSLSAGTILLSADENIGEQDYTITHKSPNDETKIWIWDYAAEDGDYVQVLVNGTPTSEAFMIKHKPKEIIVPSVGDIQIKGIKDGGGGITYAVRYELNGTNYFNSAPEGEYNTYTLIME